MAPQLLDAARREPDSRNTSPFGSAPHSVELVGQRHDDTVHPGAVERIETAQIPDNRFVSVRKQVRLPRPRVAARAAGRPARGLFASFTRQFYRSRSAFRPEELLIVDC